MSLRADFVGRFRSMGGGEMGVSTGLVMAGSTTSPGSGEGL